MVVNEEAVPFGILLMADQMRGRGAVLIVDEVEAEGLQQRELGHFGFIEHTTAAILQTVTVLGRADVGNEVEFPLWSGHRWLVGHAVLSVTCLGQLLLPLFPTQLQKNRNNHQHKTDYHNING